MPGGGKERQLRFINNLRGGGENEHKNAHSCSPVEIEKATKKNHMRLSNANACSILGCFRVSHHPMCVAGVCGCVMPQKYRAQLAALSCQ